MKTLDIYQIYFDKDSYDKCYKWAIPYYNEVLTPYFENIPIVDIVENYNGNADYIGIWSYDFAKPFKNSEHAGHKNGMKANNEEHLLHRLNTKDIDSLTFFRKLEKNRNFKVPVIHMSDKAHGSAIYSNLITLANKEGVFKECLNINERSPICFQNSQIARVQIYKDFVVNYLKPFIQWLDIPNTKQFELAWKNSKYNKVLPLKKYEEISLYYEKLTGQNVLFKYYPMHTFVCERLYSLYLMNNKIKNEQW